MSADKEYDRELEQAGSPEDHFVVTLVTEDGSPIMSWAIGGENAVMMVDALKAGRVEVKQRFMAWVDV